MSDLRLESLPFEHNGKTYLLRCNMNVLADVQEENNGKISDAFEGRRGMKSCLQFLAAMMNDYADEQNWPERFTWRALGRAVRREELPMAEIMGLVVRALTPATEATESEQPGN